MKTAPIVNVSVKTCSRCGVEKRGEDFQWKNRARGIRRSWCRPCALAYSRQHYLSNTEKYKAKSRARRPRDRLRNRMFVDDYLRAHPCVDCGTTDIAVLEFDHRDPSQKRDCVSRLAMSASWGPVLREIEKCEVRCANCHRQRTARQFGWAKLEAKPDRSSVPMPWVAIGRAPSDPDFLRACIWCNQLKALSGFAFKKAATGALNSHCRSCHAAYRRQHYLNNKADYFRSAIAQTRRKMQEARARLHAHLAAHPCVDCGETNVATLDFDHVDPTTKTKAVGEMIGHRTWHSIQLEIDKCEVRCANCHRRRTIAQQNGFERDGGLVQSLSARE